MTSWSRRRFGGALAGIAILATSGLAAGRSAERPRTHEVTIRVFRFDPPRLTIRPGDRVRWINRDIAPHTATGDDWDTGALDRGATLGVEFPGTGRFSYLCAFHPAMTGEIVVEAPD